MSIQDPQDPQDPSSSMAEDVSSPRETASPVPGLRRAVTVDESAPLRHRPSTSRYFERLRPYPRRRSSNLSSFSVDDARKQFQASTDDLLLPKPTLVGQDGSEQSHWQSAPLVFALLPAIGGMFFQNGSAVVTDMMILGLAAVFLNWSVRLPWDWYRSAQEIRKWEENSGDVAIEEESGDDAGLDASQTSLEDVPEETPAPRQESTKRRTRRLPAHGPAVNELYAHELIALLSCFIFPILGSYLLHSIRSSLSRPSEGLVSNYNLTIFLMASELRPLSHLVKLIQARTLHLQRFVNTDSYDSMHSRPSGAIEQLIKRVEELEAKSQSPESVTTVNPSEPPLNGKQVNTITTEIRRTLQPELDSLNRAVRRYEKRLATQTMQTEARLLDLESRLADAISLAAAAAQNGQKVRYGFSGTLLEWLAAAVVLPLQVLGTLMRLPFSTIKALIGIGKTTIASRQPADRGRKTVSSKHASHGRIGTDRLQGRIFKR